MIVEIPKRLLSIDVEWWSEQWSLPIPGLLHQLSTKPDRPVKFLATKSKMVCSHLRAM